MAEWRVALANHGVWVDVIDADRALLVDEHTAAELAVRLVQAARPLTASKLPPAPAEESLLVVPRATPAFIAHARANGWNVVTEDGALDVLIGSRHLVSRPSDVVDPASDPARRARPGAYSWTLHTVVRHLAALAAVRLDRPGALPVRVTQHELAKLVNASQPTISRCLGRLERESLVEVARGNISVPSTDALIEWWLRTYPGAKGLTSYWYGLDEPNQQAAIALSQLAAHSPGTVAVSGDVGADQIAPWQRPAVAKIYARRAQPLTDAGFVHVATAEEATLQVTVPADPGVWLTDLWPVPRLGSSAALADPLQVLYDLRQTTSTTAAEAASHLKTVLLGPLASAWADARLGTGSSTDG